MDKKKFIEPQKITITKNTNGRTEKLYLESTKIVSSNEKIVPVIQKYEFESCEDTKNSKTQKRFLNFVDSLLAIFVFSPLVIGYWRGTWKLMNIYEKVHPNALPLWPSFVFSVLILLFFALIRDSCVQIFNNKKKTFFDTVLSQILRKTYLCVFCVVCIMHWRSSWLIGDRFFMDPNDIVVITSLCLLTLGVLRCVRNCGAPPFIVVLDHKDITFNFPTRFRTSIFGYSIAAIAFAMQPFMRWLCGRLTGFWRILVADFYLFFSVIGTVNVWRGIWNLLDIYFLPDHPELSCWTCHWACLILLVLLNCSNTLLVRGVYIDCEEPAGKCVVFPCYYLRLIFKAERQKRRQLHVETLAKRNQQLECLNVNCTSDKHCNCASENHVILLQHVLEPNHVDV